METPWKALNIPSISGGLCTVPRSLVIVLTAFIRTGFLSGGRRPPAQSRLMLSRKVCRSDVYSHAQYSA
jgi:hypothetical protein